MSIRIPFRKTTITVIIAAALGVGALAYHEYGTHAFGWREPAFLAVHAAPVPGVASRSGLPDFAALVARNGAAVVNITVESPTREVALPQDENPFAGTPFGEFFRFLPQPDAAPRRGLGSGFLVSEDGYLLTNAHVVGDAATVTVKLTDKREFEGKVIGRDRATDVALVKIPATGLPHVKLGNANDLRVGDWVVAIGSPYGFDNSVTAGIVSAKGRTLPDDTYVPFIQTDVAVNPGNSGGPLFNLEGEVVGINSQIYSRSGGYQGLSFAIPIDVAQKVAGQLKVSGKVTRGWIGVAIQEVNQDLARSFHLDKPRGALVASVADNGPAHAAGLKAGDVIVAFDGQAIGTSGDLPPLVGAATPDAGVKLDIVRDGAPMSLTVKVARLPDEPGGAAAATAEATGARLGVVVADLSPGERKELGVDHGVLVRQVAPGVAARAGIQAGDVILQMNGKPVGNAASLKAETARLPDGKPAALLVKRGGNTLFLAITPGHKAAG
ncbi:MAG: DegQ family serine endoprotease [Burkholderiales bacterium]|nr:DegQ family serine endoprotease [Burkholderiales bacterium]